MYKIIYTIEILFEIPIVKNLINLIVNTIIIRGRMINFNKVMSLILEKYTSARAGMRNIPSK